MATWTNVPNSVLEPGDPIRSVDIIAIKENIIALSEGASGAPAIQTPALATGERMNTTNVLNATAGASAGAVGTYALLWDSTSTSGRLPGVTLAGSSLQYAATSIGGTVAGNSGTSPAGTWRLMGASGWSNGSASSGVGTRTSVWLRIS
jgi:Tfp pilus assembly protein PilV